MTTDRGALCSKTLNLGYGFEVEPGRSCRVKIDQAGRPALPHPRFLCAPVLIFHIPCMYTYPNA